MTSPITAWTIHWNDISTVNLLSFDRNPRVNYNQTREQQSHTGFDTVGIKTKRRISNNKESQSKRYTYKNHTHCLGVSGWFLGWAGVDKETARIIIRWFRTARNCPGDSEVQRNRANGWLVGSVPKNTLDSRSHFPLVKPAIPRGSRNKYATWGNSRPRCFPLSTLMNYAYNAELESWIGNGTLVWSIVQRFYFPRKVKISG